MTASAGCPRLETERLVLRAFTEDDLDDYCAVLQADAVWRALRRNRPPTREQAWTEMALWLGQWALRGTGQWVVEERATGRVIGRAGLHHPPREWWPGVEVGWALHPDAWGAGYATEAGRAARDYAFEVRGDDEVFSVILASNERSAAVARRLGLTPDREEFLPTVPDEPHVIWRLGRGDWAGRGGGGTA